MASELVKGFSHRKEQSKREAFQKEIAKKPFDFAVYDKLAQEYYYTTRGIKRRPDVRVVACFYYPDAKIENVYLPLSYFPPTIEEKYWCVVAFFGGKEDRKIRGYLRIQELVKERVARKWEAVASTSLKSKPGIHLQDVKKGTVIGPMQTDVAWEALQSVSAKMLIDKPQEPDPEEEYLLRTSNSKLESLVRPTKPLLAIKGPESESGDDDKKLIVHGSDRKQAHSDDEDDEDEDSVADSELESIDSRARPIGPVQHGMLGPDGKIIEHDPDVNPYPTPEQDEASSRAGKDRKAWRVGDRLDIKDDGVWYAATVKAINDDADQILVGFDGYHKEFDVWLARDSLRLAPLHKFSETSAERMERMAYLHNSGGKWGGGRDGVGMESFFNLVKKNKAISGLNEQLEDALRRARAYIDEIKRQFYDKTGQFPEMAGVHPKEAAAARAAGGFSEQDEKLFDAMQYVMIIDALKAEVLRLQEQQNKLQSDEQVGSAMLRDSLREFFQKRKDSGKAFVSESERQQRRGSQINAVDEEFDPDKKHDIVYMIRLMQEEFKRMQRESEFREQQLAEYQVMNRRMAEESAGLQQKFNDFRNRKSEAMKTLARTVLSDSASTNDAQSEIDRQALAMGSADDDLMAKIHRLQAFEVQEVARMQQQIDEYERKQHRENGAVKETDASSSDESDEEEGPPLPDEEEFVTIDPKKLNPSSKVAQAQAMKSFDQTEQQFRLDELSATVSSLQQELTEARERNRQLEGGAGGRGRRNSAYLYSGLLLEGDQNMHEDDIDWVPTVKDLNTFLRTNELGVEAFQKFLADEHAEENILFWKAVRDYQELFDVSHPSYKTNKMIQVPTAQQIVDNFIKPGAPRQITISAPIQKGVMDEVKSGRVRAETFNAALEMLLEKMTGDHFARFVKTTVYKRLAKRIAAVNAPVSPYTAEIDGMLAEYQKYRRKVSDGNLVKFLQQHSKAPLEDWFFKLSEERRGLVEQLMAQRDLNQELIGSEAEKKAAVTVLERSFAKYKNRKNSQNPEEARAFRLLQAAKVTIHFETGTKSNINHVRRCMTSIKTEVYAAQKDFVNIFQAVAQALGNVVGLIRVAQENYRAEVNKRIKLFDALQNLRGNIRVFCRVRPMLNNERDRGETNCIEYLGATQLMVMRNKMSRKDAGDFLDSQKQSGKAFTFDRVFGPNVDQSRVFADVKNIVGSVLDGYNVCIFAYGQTGSGKTYTMEGPAENPGINQRAIAAVFDGIKALSPQYKFQVHVSLLEIYNERLYDLLSEESLNYELDDEAVSKRGLEGDLEQMVDPEAEEKDSKYAQNRLQIRRNARGMYVTNTTHVQVETVDDVRAVVIQGYKNRTVRATNANEHSSRSHAILLVTVDGIDQVTLNRTYGKLYLVDLAGSERIKETESTGQRLVEANYINKSLSALGDVMRVLSERKSAKDNVHIPYRNSKLTYLLQDALGGNSKTMMVVNISPGSLHAQETLCSLEFARRVRKVQLDPHQSTQNAALQKYKVKLADMKEQARVTTEKLKKSLEKMEQSVRERDQIIQQLTEKLKTTRKTAADFKRRQYLGGAAPPTPVAAPPVVVDSWTVDRPVKLRPSPSAEASLKKAAAAAAASGSGKKLVTSRVVAKKKAGSSIPSIAEHSAEPSVADSEDLHE